MKGLVQMICPFQSGDFFRFHVVYRHRALQVGLIGPNGCGKSTQLLMLMKQVSPGGGRSLGLSEWTKLPSEGYESVREIYRIPFLLG